MYFPVAQSAEKRKWNTWGEMSLFKREQTPRAAQARVGIDRPIPGVSIDAEFQKRMTVESPQILRVDEYPWCSALLKDGTCLASLRCQQRAVKMRDLSQRGLTPVQNPQRRER